MEIKVSIDGVDVSNALGEQWKASNIPSLAKQRELEEVAYVDSLTKVYNLAGFSKEGKRLLDTLQRFERVEDDIERNSTSGLIQKTVTRLIPGNLLKRKTDGAAYLLIDLDGFKEINDTYGHGAGDTVLQQIAQLVKNRTRGNDIVGRIGGDEFAVLVRIKDEKDLKSFVKDLQNILDNHHVNIDGKKIKATGTIGFQSFDMNETDPIAVAKKGADEDMYAKKRKRYPGRAPR